MARKGTPGAETEDGFRFRRRTGPTTRSRSMPAASTAPLVPLHDLGRYQKLKHSTAQKPSSTRSALTAAERVSTDDREESPSARKRSFTPVDPTAELPPGKRLKRHVRLEKRKGELTEAQKREILLSESRLRCSRIYREVNPDLSEREQLLQLVEKILETEHFRSIVGDDSDFAAIAVAAKHALFESNAAQIKPLLRPNPKNKELARAEVRLQAVIENSKRGIDVWKKIARDIEQMESQKLTLPVVRATGESAEDVEIAAIMKTSQEVVEDYVLQADSLKSAFCKMEKKSREADANALKVLHVLEKRVVREVESIKTPRKPEQLPKGHDFASNL